MRKTPKTHNDYAYQIHAKKNQNENDETCVLNMSKKQHSKKVQEHTNLDRPWYACVFTDPEHIALSG